MPESLPTSGAPRPVTATFTYTVEPDWVRQQIIETGLEPSDTWVMHVDLRELDRPEERQIVLHAYRVYEAAPGIPELPEPTDDPTVVARAVLEQLATEDESQVDTQEQAAFAADRDAWIEAHGSPRLRLANTRGYAISKTYLEERARVDLPEFWVDTGSRASWKERANPTEAALNLETAVDEHLAEYEGYAAGKTGSLIVWVTRFPDAMEEHVERLGEAGVVVDDQVEAILVRPWLGRYDLYLPVDAELRAPADDVAGDDQ